MAVGCAARLYRWAHLGVRLPLALRWCEFAVWAWPMLKKVTEILGHLAFYGWPQYGIGKKIIGRGNAARGWRLGAGWRAIRLHSVFALVDQPPGNGGRRILFKPLIHQCADLFAEVGGMAEARQFIALQAVARGSQQELPGRLSSGIGSQGSSCGDRRDRAETVTL